MIVGVGLDSRLRLPFGELREAARSAEALGFESAWTPAGGVPDAFGVCLAWSLDTSLRTGISVVPVARMWTARALAVQAATVAQVSGGRFVVGLGTGGYGPEFWSSVGLANRPIAVMRDYVGTVGRLLAGETVTHHGPAVTLDGVSLGVRDLPPCPVYLGALGPQMVTLAGEVADGVLLNWATPERIAESRRLVSAGAAKAGRDPGEVTVTMYIRVCVDDDVEAARRAFGEQVLGYAMGRPGTPPEAGYRGLFAQMGYDEVLSELEARRDRGATMDELVAATPDEMLHEVGYYGPPAGAAATFARLSEGLDETVVRVITARRGLDAVVATMEALTPSLIRNAAHEARSSGV
jgi:alkanesulfonate monooxygenase SsuD/methylene tetrahydromethanopterin reductase-like flavin-dependent oxidoreductase (luciferase family)